MVLLPSVALNLLAAACVKDQNFLVKLPGAPPSTIPGNNYHNHQYKYGIGRGSAKAVPNLSLKCLSQLESER